MVVMIHSQPMRRSLAAILWSAVGSVNGGLLHGNGLLELRCRSGAALSSLDAIETGLPNPATGILLVVDGSESCDADAILLASLEQRDRIALLRREAGVREALRAHPCVIAVGAGRHVDGTAAGLFMAADYRIVNEQTSLSLSGCQMGLLPSGLSLLGAAVDDDAGCALAMAFAVGATHLNAHDAHRVLSARFVRSADLPELLEELRRSPSEYLDVPIARRSGSVPAHHANLLRRGVDTAVERVFGAEDDRAMLESLGHERRQVAKLLDSCAWQTREVAEGVSDVLTAAAKALDPQRASAPALRETVRVLRRCFEASDAARAHRIELQAMERLAKRADFAPRARAGVRHAS